MSQFLWTKRILLKLEQLFVIYLHVTYNNYVFVTSKIS